MPFKMGALQRVTESSISTEGKTFQMSEFEADTKENSMGLKEVIGKSKGTKGYLTAIFKHKDHYMLMYIDD